MFTINTKLFKAIYLQEKKNTKRKTKFPTKRKAKSTTTCGKKEKNSRRILCGRLPGRRAFIYYDGLDAVINAPADE